VARTYYAVADDMINLPSAYEWEVDQGEAETIALALGEDDNVNIYEITVKRVGTTRKVITVDKVRDED
jgi:predicted nucleic acid-binding protein